MAVDIRLNLMVDLACLPDALEDALPNRFELVRFGPRSDEEEQRDVDAAKAEADVRVELIRTRILHKALSHAPKEF